MTVRTILRRRTRALAMVVVMASAFVACGPRWKTAQTVTATTATVATTTGDTVGNADSTPSTVAPSSIPAGSTPTSVAVTVPVSSVPASSSPSASTPTTAAATSTTLDDAAAKAQIAANWSKFFDAATPIPDRIPLLENGPSMQQALVLRAQDPLMKQASATVKSVTLTAPDQAMVSYDVLLSGKVALADAQGTAVLQDGVWKVSVESFCALISLGATAAIPGC